MTQEGANLTARQTFIDLAGNQVVATLGGINIDRTRPRIGFRFAHLPQNPPATPAQLQADLARLNETLVALAAENGQLYERARLDASRTLALLRELQHRVRNNLAAIQALLVLERHRSPSRSLCLESG